MTGEETNKALWCRAFSATALGSSELALQNQPAHRTPAVELKANCSSENQVTETILLPEWMLMHAVLCCVIASKHLCETFYVR